MHRRNLWSTYVTVVDEGGTEIDDDRLVVEYKRRTWDRGLTCNDYEIDIGYLCGRDLIDDGDINVSLFKKSVAFH